MRKGVKVWKLPATGKVAGDKEDLNQRESPATRQTFFVLPVTSTGHSPDVGRNRVQPGTSRVGFKDFDLSMVDDLPKDAIIVTYCSVGYRSERIGEKLKKAGF